MLTWGPPGKYQFFVDRTTLRRLIEIFKPEARVLDVMMVLKVLGVGMSGGVGMNGVGGGEVGRGQQ